MNNTTAEQLFTEHIAVRIVRLVLYPIVFLVGVIGNISVCAIILRRKSKKFRSTKGYFILNLALSDLMVLLLFLPFDLAYLENHSVWPFGDFLCKLINVLTNVSVTVSGSTLICIGYERYKAIVKSLKSRLSKRKAVIMVLSTWIYSCVLQIPFMFALIVDPRGKCLIDLEWWADELSFQLTYIMGLFVPQFLIPAICIIVFYACIIFHLRKAHQMNSKRGIYTSKDVTEKRGKQNRKTTKLLTGLVVVYAICILPQKAILVAIILNPTWLTSHVARELYEFTRLLTTANSCLNPVLYTTISHGFRKDLKSMFSRQTERSASKFLKYLHDTRHSLRQANPPTVLTHTRDSYDTIEGCENLREDAV